MNSTHLLIRRGGFAQPCANENNTNKSQAWPNFASGGMQSTLDVAIEFRDLHYFPILFQLFAILTISHVPYSKISLYQSLNMPRKGISDKQRRAL